MVLQVKDMVGKRFGRLVVTGLTRVPAAGTIVDCVCDCGNTVSVKKHNLIRGSTTSCGCVWKEKITTHGKTKTRAYVIWRGMKSRCRPDSANATNYFNRGIEVCKRWGEFENFYADMGDPPDAFTLERIDNNKGYSPENCKWASYEENLSNRRNSNFITAFGKTQTLTRWAREAKLPVSTLKNRLFRAKMDPEAALLAKPYAQQRKS